jgi:hypothetical protein
MATQLPPSETEAEGSFEHTQQQQLAIAQEV